MRSVVLGGLTALLVSVPALGKDPNQSWTEWRAMRRCAQQRPVSCIHRAALHHRVSFGWLKSVAWCESRYDPHAVNGRYMGLYQFGWPLWSSLPYHRHSPYSAKWASLAAALAFRNGLSRNWECA